MKKILFLSLLIIIGILFASQIKRGFLGLLILADSVRPPEKALMGRLINGPIVKTITVTAKDKKISADLYIPKSKGNRFPLLLVHDASPAGKDDKQLILLAKDLSRAGFLVMVPDFIDAKALRLRVTNAEDVLRCFDFLSAHELAGRRGGGVIGMGLGSGPALLAAADPRIRDKVRVIATFGGYYDLRNVMLFALTGAYEYGGQRDLIRPDTSLRWMVAYKNLDLLRSTEDRATLKKIIEKRNHYETAGADALVQTLRPEGMAVHAFLVNKDPERFSPLYEALPHSVRETVYQLSPGRAMKYITAHLIIAHATDDFAVPYTESMRLADAAGSNNRAHLALLPQFLQSMPGEPSTENWLKRYVLGGWRLFSAIYDLLEESA